MRANHKPVSNTAPFQTPPSLDIDRHALFLDLDGTLLEIADRPHAVVVSAELRQLLRDLSRTLSGAVAVITGRTIRDADQLLEGAVPFISGVHGYELQRGQHITRDAALVRQLSAARADLSELLRQHQSPALIEDKGASIALHYRHAPEAESAVRSLAAHIAKSRNLRVLPGKMVVELIASARTKGHALTVLMAQPPFSGRLPIAIGDDRTDEDAFTAAERLGGWGVRVGEATNSAARYMLANPSTVAAWLRSGIGA